MCILLQLQHTTRHLTIAVQGTVYISTLVELVMIYQVLPSLYLEAHRRTRCTTTYHVIRVPSAHELMY